MRCHVRHRERDLRSRELTVLDERRLDRDAVHRDTLHIPVLIARPLRAEREVAAEFARAVYDDARKDGRTEDVRRVAGLRVETEGGPGGPGGTGRTNGSEGGRERSTYEQRKHDKNGLH